VVICLVLAHLGSPGKRAVERVCVCVCIIIPLVYAVDNSENNRLQPVPVCRRQQRQSDSEGDSRAGSHTAPRQDTPTPNGQHCIIVTTPHKNNPVTDQSNSSIIHCYECAALCKDVSLQRPILHQISTLVWCLQCFDAVGWAAGRASGL